MYITYMDETGDPGFPGYSELFLLTSIYMPDWSWKENYEKVLNFRKELNELYGLPVRVEFHTKQFLTNKQPYKQFGWSKKQRINILYGFFDVISTLDLRIVNVCINKKNITGDYDVFERALTYNIQRIENDLSRNQLSEAFMVFTDEGNLNKMKQITRRMQRFNYIPSKVHPGESFRQEVSRLIEDPIGKRSEESYFVQLADLISAIMHLYCLKQFNGTAWGKRISGLLTETEVVELLNIIHRKLNLEASSSNEYGVVHFPK